MDIERLNEAFHDFTRASHSLETYYAQLQDKIKYLTTELELRNTQLNDALASAEQNKDYLNAVLHSLEEAITVVDPEGRVTMMNRAAEGLFSVSHADTLGKQFTSLDFTFSRDGAETLLEVRGRKYPVIISHADVVDAEGRLRGRVILVKDISRQRELELRHERNQRLISMGEMAAKIVHEIRNPLCSMELYASMLEKEVSSASQQELAAGISTGIGNLNNILTNMLLFARPHRPAMRAVRLDSVVDESVRMVRPMMESKNIRVTLSPQNCEIAGDAELLKQVFMNILINAVQAMPGGGDVGVSFTRGGEAIVVSIRDSGVGIPADHLEKIFDPFYSTKDNGTGLGLVIASNIMQSVGGYITVDSEPGKGSVFNLAFPAGTLRHEDRAPRTTVNSEEVHHAQ